MVVAEVTALAFVEDAEALLREIAAETHQHGDKHLLINLLDVVGTLTPAQHQYFGQLAARHLSHLDKVASLVPEEKVTRISEREAQIRGTRLRVFHSLADAMAWLTE